jgi:recombination protein RecT
MTKAMVPKKAEAFRSMESFLMDQKARSAIARVLPSGMSAERLVRFAMAATTRYPQLLQCSPHSVMLALMDAAYYGLEPNPVLGHAYLIPYENKKIRQVECQFMIGYKGLIVLGERSDLLKGTVAEAVYKEDVFHWRRHEQPPFFHDVNLESKFRAPKDIRVAYCAVLRKTDFWEGIALSRDQVERYRSMSRGRDAFAWKDHWDAMAIKTAVRRTYGKLPLGADSKLAVAVAQDVAFDIGEPIRHTELLEGAIDAPEMIDRGERMAAELEGGDGDPGPAAE